MMDSEELVRLFWGKAGRGGVLAVHPAVFHMLDVGLVARELATRAPSGALQRLGRELGVTPDRVPHTLALLVALHDLGKISPGFQCKVPALAQIILEAGFPFPKDVETDHAMTTQVALARRAGGDWWGRALRALGAHHGTFHGPGLGSLGDAPGERKYGQGLWAEAREEAIRALAGCFGLDAEAVDALLAPRDLTSGTAMILAGLTTLADWIGSDADHFPPAGSQFTTLTEYLPHAQSRAVEAVDATGWGPSPAGGATEFGELFPGKTPNPLQRLAANVGTELTGPGLVLIEAPMGQGKTEAALSLARCCMARFRHQGIYVALPTQATCNQMFERFRTFLASGWPEKALHLHLLHGLASFHDAYDQLPDLPETLEPAGLDGPDAGSTERDEAQHEKRVYAAGWFRGAKRGLLAPFAVGTLDQALLGVLPVRHMFLRLFGLANKVVIIDEAHAYETYTTTLLEELTAWLRELGCTVIILSATLPREKRSALLRAYTGTRPSLPEEEYPRITWVDARGQIHARQPEPDDETAGSRYTPPPLGLRPWPEDRTPADEKARQDLGRRLAASLGPGSAVAWFCNTVASAQETFLLLNALPELRGRVRLLHAALPVRERRRREKELLETLGPDCPRPEAGVVWVSTQVLEQSLDVDFDGMVSELAPIDLLLQRAGREHRHPRTRPPGFRERVLWWLHPAASENDEETPAFGVDALIYQGYPLLRTLALLQGPCVVETDGQIEELVEAVYGAEPLAMPTAFNVLAEKYTGEWKERRQLGQFHALLAAIRRPTDDDPFAPPKLLADDDETLEHTPRVQPSTREGDRTVTVICAVNKPDGPRVETDGDPADPSHAPRGRDARREWERNLLLQSVRLQHWGWVDYLVRQDPPSAWKDSPALRNCRLVTFQDGVAPEGPTELRLHPTLGLVRARPVLARLLEGKTNA